MLTVIVTGGSAVLVVVRVLVTVELVRVLVTVELVDGIMVVSAAAASASSCSFFAVALA